MTYKRIDMLSAILAGFGTGISLTLMFVEYNGLRLGLAICGALFCIGLIAFGPPGKRRL